MIRRLIDKIFTVTGRKIVQFSPQRSDGTLVCNILQDLFLNVKREIEKFKNFNEFDVKSHFHGDHISKYLGATNYYKKFFNTNQIKILDKYFNNQEKYLNYEQ
tara:strand:- start:87 stop:395 length:309 start_codon:yes stop_codon:yes gene_type:complete